MKKYRILMIIIVIVVTSVALDVFVWRPKLVGESLDAVERQKNMEAMKETAGAGGKLVEAGSQIIVKSNAELARERKRKEKLQQEMAKNEKLKKVIEGEVLLSNILSSSSNNEPADNISFAFIEVPKVKHESFKVKKETEYNYTARNIYMPYYSISKEGKKGTSDISLKGIIERSGQKIAVVSDTKRIYYKKAGESIGDTNFVIQTIDDTSISIAGINSDEIINLELKR